MHNLVVCGFSSQSLSLIKQKLTEKYNFQVELSDVAMFLTIIPITINVIQSDMNHA